MSELAALAKHPDDPEASSKLAAALGSKVSFVVARAAEIAGQFQLRSLAADLMGAFNRLLNDSKSPDKGCAAKTAIAKTLYELGEPAAEAVFLSGIEYHEMTGGYGGPIDVAAELRGYCGLGLVRIASRQAMIRLVDLLADPAPQARAFAARALAYSERDEAALLLRFKLLTGDREIDVMSECLSSLVRIRQPDLVPFVTKFLDGDDPEIRIAAALALGETRQADALDVLRDHHPRESDPDVRRTILLAAATLRIPAAIDWVVSRVESSRAEDAVDALEALSIYKHDPAIAERAKAASATRKEPEILRALKTHFGPT